MTDLKRKVAGSAPTGLDKAAADAFDWSSSGHGGTLNRAATLRFVFLDVGCANWSRHAPAS